MNKFHQEEKKEPYKNKTQDEFDNYIKERNKRLQMTASERARNSEGWFKFIYFTLTYDNPTVEQIKKAEQISEQYYIENKYRIWTDISAFREMFTGSEIANSSGLNIIISTIGNDIRDAVKNKEYEEGRQKDLMGNYVD